MVFLQVILFPKPWRYVCNEALGELASPGGHQCETRHEGLECWEVCEMDKVLHRCANCSVRAIGVWPFLPGSAPRRYRGRSALPVPARSAYASPRVAPVALQA